MPRGPARAPASGIRTPPLATGGFAGVDDDEVVRRIQESINSGQIPEDFVNQDRRRRFERHMYPRRAQPKEAPAGVSAAAHPPGTAPYTAFHIAPPAGADPWEWDSQNFPAPPPPPAAAPVGLSSTLYNIPPGVAPSSVSLGLPPRDDPWYDPNEDVGPTDVPQASSTAGSYPAPGALPVGQPSGYAQAAGPHAPAQ